MMTTVISESKVLYCANCAAKLDVEKIVNSIVLCEYCGSKNIVSSSSETFLVERNTEGQMIVTDRLSPRLEYESKKTVLEKDLASWCANHGFSLDSSYVIWVSIIKQEEIKRHPLSPFSRIRRTEHRIFWLNLKQGYEKNHYTWDLTVKINVNDNEVFSKVKSSLLELLRKDGVSKVEIE
ncbi:hypothetical protein MUP01_12075 [Candidatus Bathyarchaeota archaeon]|nr:hypothetical protein [Candidatus Bathyarchaeota archaeon]